MSNKINSIDNTNNSRGKRIMSEKENSSFEKKVTKNAHRDIEVERNYRPVRQSRESRSGCLGGLMYFGFVLCAGIVLACFAWMAASDALALNKDDISAEISLPSEIFTEKIVDDVDDEGNVVGTKEVSSADISYVSSALKETGIIQYKWLFEFFCKLSNADTKIDPGVYSLDSSLDYRAIIKNMQTGAGAAITVDVMIPEGYTMDDIFLLLEEKGVSSYDELIDAAKNYTFNYEFINKESIGDASRLEGYLFPDTYQFYVGMQASSAINKLLSNFNSKWTADLERQCSEMGYSMKEIITIASLIEKEAAVDPAVALDERSVVASVIYNRLNSGMALGLESSILYLHQQHEGAPTVDMLQEDSPYNTNINVGLPPTPICNPSFAAVSAALNPENTNYLFFYYDSDAGFSRFFSTYNEFNAFVESKNNDN